MVISSIRPIKSAITIITTSMGKEKSTSQKMKYLIAPGMLQMTQV